MKYIYEVSNRLSEPFNDAKLRLIIEANNSIHADRIASEFGFKHHLLLTGPK